MVGADPAADLEILRNCPIGLDGTVGILDLLASKDARDQYDPEL